MIKMKPSSTIEVIEATFRAAQADPSAILLDLPRRKVFRANGKVIKFGPDVDIREATAMSFIAKSAITLPVPEVFRAETYEDGSTVIEMEMISGENLHEVWPRLSIEEKRDFAQQLKEILEELRSFEGTYIGSFEEGPALDMRRDIQRGGPFLSETDFNAFLLGNVVSKTPNIYRRMLHGVMSDTHKIVLTHGDLSPRNILVRESRIVGLLDWECAGWYPEYWEFVQFFRAIDSSLDWHDYADIIFTESYPHELMTDHFLGRLTRH
jgi:serine/threonine protein kinase